MAEIKKGILGGFSGKVGTELRLELENENKFYAKAVAIYYKDYKLV